MADLQRGTVFDTLDAVGKGFSVQEIMWEMSEGQVWIRELNWIHQKRFTFNTKIYFESSGS